MNIYVGNLSNNATDETIREAFESFGQVTSAKIIKDKYSGQSRGFGFVEMPELAQAQAAVKSLNGKELLGKQMNVNEARPRTTREDPVGKGVIQGDRVTVVEAAIDPVVPQSLNRAVKREVS